MRKKNTWESRLVILLLRRRLLLLGVVVGLQLLLVAAIAGLLWLTKVQDSIAAFALADGRQTAVLEAAPSAASIELLVGEGSLVSAGQPLARADGREIVAQEGGVVWGTAFRETAGSEEASLPLLSLIDPSSVRWQVDVGESTGIVFSEGMHGSLRLDRLAQEAASPFRSIFASDGDRLLRDGVVLLELDVAEIDATSDWYGLGAMLTRGERGRVLLQVRARRLLALMLRR